MILANSYDYNAQNKLNTVLRWVSVISICVGFAMAFGTNQFLWPYLLSSIMPVFVVLAIDMGFFIKLPEGPFKPKAD